MSDYLPQEILIQILAKLPVKSLLQLRCVSKSWYSLISSPDFITIHLSLNLNSKRNNLLLFKHNKCQSVKYKDDLYFTLNHEDTFDEYARFENPFTNVSTGLGMVGSCNGLFCFEECDSIMLWNPSIKKVVTIPTPNINYGTHDPNIVVVGFGFDYRANDYKVLRLVYLKGSDEICLPKVELYKLSKRSWSGINCTAPSHRLCFHSNAYLNEAVHRIAINKIGVYRCLVVAFDMVDEVFREMELPDRISSNDFYISTSGKSLVLCHTSQHPLSNHYSIWVMKEYGVAKSWVNQYNIILVGGKKFFIRMMKNGELFLAKTSRRLISYNPKNREIKDVEFPGPRFFSFYMNSYMESLVLLNERHVDVCDAVTFKREEDEIGEQQRPTMKKENRD